MREITHPIRHQLIARRDARARTQVTKVISIPTPTGSAARSSDEHLANVEHEATNSTAEAVRRVSRVDRPWVAIGTRLAAEMYECMVVRDDIEDSLDNRTRFVYLARDAGAAGPRGALQDEHRLRHRRRPAGSLLLILSEFAHRYVNLTKIESRPSKQGLGDYIFFIDIEGRAQRPAHRPGAQVPRLQAAVGQGAGLVPDLTSAGGAPWNA